MAWVDKKKAEKVVVYKEDKERAKAIRDKAKTKLQQAGIEGKETKKGVGRDVAKTKRGQRDQQAREKINKAVYTGPGSDGILTHDGVDKKGFKDAWG